jgi:hypothetical protein
MHELLVILLKHSVVQVFNCALHQSLFVFESTVFGSISQHVEGGGLGDDIVVLNSKPKENIPGSKPTLKLRQRGD